MFTIQDYIDSLNRDKESLVANLTTKGITCSDSETFTTLVPKVLDITSVNNQSKSETITTNTTTTITPDIGYTGLSSVEVTTNVALDLSEYFTSTIGSGSGSQSGLYKMIKSLPSTTTVSGTSLAYSFSRYYGTSLPLIDTSNVTDMTSTFINCSNLTTIPVYNTSSVINFSGTFTNTPNLNTTSLDNILQMCINATSYNGTKTLATLGLTSTNYPSATIEALPHYQDFLDAGWTIGY